jgi:hypothetical protein
MSGFLGYFNVIPTGSISSLLLIYGFIISLIGFALSTPSSSRSSASPTKTPPR